MRPNAPTARALLALLPAIPTVLALAGTLVLFSLFLLVQGQPVLDAVGLIFQGAFGSSLTSHGVFFYRAARYAGCPFNLRLTFSPGNIPSRRGVSNKNPDVAFCASKRSETPL